MVKVYTRVKTRKITEAQVYPDALAVLKECLESIPNATVVVNQDIVLSPGKRADFVAAVTVAGRRVTLIAEWKKSGEPQFARHAINQMHAYRLI